MQEVREGRWSYDGHEAFLDGELFPRDRRGDRPRLGKCSERGEGSSLSRIGDRRTRLAGSELAVGLLIGKTIVCMWNSRSSRSGRDELAEVLAESVLCRGRRWQVRNFHPSSRCWLWWIRR